VSSSYVAICLPAEGVVARVWKCDSCPTKWNIWLTRLPFAEGFLPGFAADDRRAFPPALLPKPLESATQLGVGNTYGGGITHDLQQSFVRKKGS
jgi:hypothetical protein